MAEQSGEIKESTRLANEFKEADLKETLAGLREESIQLAASGEVLKTAIEDVTGSELVLVEQTGLAEDKFTSAAGKIRELGADLNLTSADAATLTSEIAAQEATLAMWIEKQAAGADSSIDLRAALEAQVEAIKNAKTDTEALALATEAFGAEGAQRLSIAIRNGAFELDNMVGSLQDTEGAILSNAEATRTNTEDLKLMRQEISERLAGAWASLPGPIQLTAGAMGGVMAAIGPMLVALPTLIGFMKGLKIATVFHTVATNAAAAAQWALNAAMSANIIGIIILAIVALVAAGVLLWQNWDTVKEKLLALWGKFEEMFGKVRDFAIEVWEKIKTFIPEALDTIIGFIQEHWDKILAILFPAVGLPILVFRNWEEIKQFISDALEAIWEKVKEVWEIIKAYLFETFEEIREPVLAIWDGLKEVWKEAWKGPTKVVQTAIGVILDLIGKVTGAWDKMNSIISKIPSIPNPFSGGSSGGSSSGRGGGSSSGRGGGGGGGGGGASSSGLSARTRRNFPGLKMFDTGGIITSPTLAMMGEREPEAVIPLSKLRSVMEGLGGGKGGLTVIVQGSIIDKEGVFQAAAEGEVQLARRGRQRVFR